MAPLTLSNYLGTLQDDPENQEAFEGLKNAAVEVEDRNAALRLIEAARVAHERRGELRATAWLIEVETALTESDPDFQGALFKELGRIRREELLDDAGAGEAFRMALERRPGDEEARDALEQIEQTAANWKDIAERFVQEAERASDDTLKSSLLSRAGALVWQYKKRSKVKEAAQLFKQALSVHPGDVRAARLYVEMCMQRDDAKEAARVLFEVAEQASNKDDRLQLYLRCARISARRLAEPEPAAACYERVLDFSPGHEEALRFLVEYLTEREQWDELVALYEDALRARHKLESEQGILLQIAMVHYRIRKSPKDAEPYFARLRKLDPAHRGMLDFYREFLAASGETHRLLTILGDAQRVLTDAEEKRALALEIARVAQQGDGSLERAIDAWKTTQRLDPTNQEARVALKELYRRTEKWNALVEILRADLDGLPKGETDRRVAILRELVGIYRENLGLDAMVIHTYNAILDEVPTDREALDRLAETYESMGRWNDLILVLTKKAESTENAAERVPLFMRIAQLWIERFANYNQATRPLEQVIEIEPAHHEALVQLKDIYVKKRAWKPLFSILSKEAELTEDPSTRLTLDIELARLLGERLHRHADAIGMWRSILARDAAVEGGLDALEKLAEREKDWAALAEALELRSARETEPPTRIKTLQKLGAVYAEHLSDESLAVSAWKRILALDPKNGKALRTLRESYLSAQDWDGLESLYVEAGDFEGLVDVLGSAAERASDDAVKIALSFRAADVYEQRIGEPYRAFRNYERVLGVDPKNARAARALLPIYEREEKWPRLVAMLEVLLEALGSAASIEERLELVAKLRDVSREKLRDPAKAFEYASRAYRLAPTHRGVAQTLEETAEAIGAFETLALTYLERLDAADEEERIRLRRRVARLAAEKLEDPATAVEQWKAILEVDPVDREAVEALDALLRQPGKEPELRSHYLHRLEHADGDGARAGLLLELAALEEDRLGDRASAAERYRSILAIDPRDRVALSALDRLALALERFDELASVIERRIEVEEESGKQIDLWLRLAELRAGSLEDESGALAAYEESLRLAPSSERAVRGLERLESKPELAIAAGRLLEGAYQARNESAKLAGVLERRLAASKSDAEVRELRLRLADLASTELGDADGAYRALEAAFRDSPTDDDLWGRLAAAAEAAGRHEGLARAIADVLEGDRLSDADVIVLAARAAEIHEVALGNPAGAEPFHKTILARDPLDERAFLALKELFTNEERWDELQALYHTRIAETVDGQAKLDLLLQVCFLFEEILEDAAQAIDAYVEVLELDPEHLASRRALERLYRRTERYRELSELLRRELDKADGQEAIDLAYELGEIHEQKLAEPSLAVDQYESVLSQVPTHLRAQEALERLLPEPSQRQRITSILEPLYEAQGAWGELARVLEVQLEPLTEPGSRVALLLRIAEIQERRLGDVSGAFATLARAVGEDATDAHVREELARLADTRDAHRERAQVLERAIEAQSGSPSMQAELLLELAQLWERKVADDGPAERAYVRIVDLGLDDPDVMLATSRALERIHFHKGDHAAVAEDLRRQIQFEHDGGVRHALLVRLAQLLEDVLSDRAGAIAAHRERLEIDAGDLDAMRSLERLYEAERDFENLIEILRSQDGVVTDEAEQKRLCRRVGEIYQRELGDTENAIASFNDLVSRFGNDTEALVSLSGLYEAAERWSDLLEVVELLHDQKDEGAERAELRFRAAELMRTRTQQVEQAIEGYREVLQTAPSHAGTITALEHLSSQSSGENRLAAARALLPHYERSQSYARLIGALEVLGESDDPVERLRSLRRAAEIAEIGLDDASRAFDLMGRAVRAGLAEDELERMLSDFERFAQMSDRWPEYVSLLDEVSPDILDVELQIAVLMKMAEVAATRLRDDGKARDMYTRVLEHRPEHAQALDALERLHEQAGDHAALLAILRRRTEIAEDPRQRVALLLRQARISEEGLDDPATAIDAYEQILLDEESPDAFRGLERLYARTERFSDLAAVQQRQLDANVGDPVEVRHRLGVTYLERLRDTAQALDCFREVIAQRSDHEPTIAVLETLMGDEAHRGEAAEILEPVFLRRMDWPKVKAALEARLSSETDIEERRVLLRRLGEIHEDYLEDLDGALESYARLFREDVRDGVVWETMARLSRALERGDRLAEIYASALEEITIDDEATARLSFLTAQLYEEKVGDIAKAGTFYRRSLAFEPTDRASFDALERVLRQSAAWESLLELYAEHVTIAETEAERLSLLHRAAGLLEDKLGDVDRAIERYREALDVDPRDAISTAGLDRLFTAHRRHRDLADHLRHCIDLVAGSPEEVALKFRLGRLLADELADAEGAIDVFEDLLAANPSHAPSIQALETLVQRPELEPRITRILEPIYQGADEWKKLIAVYEAQTVRADDPLEKRRLLGEIAKLHEARGRDGQLAFDAWVRAFATEPHDEEARREVERLAGLLEAWDALIAAYETAIDASDDPILVSDLLRAIALVHDERRGDPRAAIRTFERLLAHDPDDPAPLESLESLQMMLGDWRGVVDVVERKVERTLDAAERGELLRRSGGILEELLGDRQGAVEAYRRAVEEDDRDATALEALDRLHSALAQHEALADVLQRRVDVEEDPAERIALGVRLGALLENQLARFEAAIDAFVRVLGDDPEQPEAGLALGRLYERQALWPELLDNLRARVGRTTELEAKISLLHRAGEVLERELDDMPEAIATYREALDLGIRHEPSIEALLRIARLEDYREQAAEVLEPLLESDGRWNDLALLVERKADAATDPLEKRDLLKRLSGIHERGRGDGSAAFEALRRALIEDPSDADAADELERIAGVLGSFDRLADTFAARASSALDPTVVRSLYVRVARIAEEKLSDDTRAIEAFSRAAEQVGDDDELLAALDRLHTKAQNFSELAEVLERRLLLATAPAAANGILLRLAAVREEKFGDLRGAFTAYQEVLDRDPSSNEALDALERLKSEPMVAVDAIEALDRIYRQSGAFEKLASLFDVQLEMAEADGDRVRLLTEAAALWERELGNPTKGAELLRRAFELDPRDESLLHDLERLVEASGTWELVRGLVERVTDEGRIDSMLARELHLRAARWYRDRLDDREATEVQLRAVLALDEESADAHSDLVALLRVPGREKDLVASLRAFAAVELDEDSRKARYREAAALAEGTLGDREVAAACHEAILDTDPSDPIALEELIRLRSAASRWEDAVELLGRRADVEADPQRRVGFKRAIAEMLSGPLESPSRAAEAYQAVLDEEPTDLSTIAALESLYEGQSRWEDLRELIERRLDIATTDGERIAARVRLARLSEQAFGRRGEAIDQLREILEIDPKNGEALDEMARLLEADGNFEELIELLGQRVADAVAANDLDGEKNLRRRLASLYEQKLAAPDKAVAAHRAILDRDARDVESLRALVRLYDTAGEWNAMAEMLERLLEELAGDEAAAVALSLAEIAEKKLADAARSERALQRAYSLSPSGEIRKRLRAHYEAHREHGKLVAILEEEERATEGVVEKIALLTKMAEIQSAELHDPSAAAASLERAAAFAPEDRNVLLPLCGLYISAGRQRDAIPVLERIIESFGNRRVKELAGYHHRLGQALEGLGETERALEHYDAAFKIDLTNVEILRDLGRLCYARGDYDRAQKTFRALLLQKLEPGAGISKADVYFYLGDISAKQGDKTKAVSMLERAMAEERNHPDASALLAQLKS